MKNWKWALALVAFAGCAEQGPAPKSVASGTSTQAKSDERADVAKADAAKTEAIQTETKQNETPPGENKGARLEKLTSANLPNPVRLCEKVISGGLPEGDEAFAELKALGVKTVISVDGAKPDVETAKKYGIRYVHLPHGYDGIPENRGKELAKAVHDLEGPIYIHCHHGKHRSPAAASVACVTAGLVPIGQAVAILKLAGTGPNYKGLYQSAERAKPLSDQELDAIDVEFVESAEIPPLAEAMVQLEHTFDLVKKLNENKWKPLSKKPDVDAAHEALLLQEHFTEMLRLDETKNQPQDFAEMLRESETAALSLQNCLTKLSHGDDDETFQQLGTAMQVIEANCKKCHDQYRNVPLGEK